MSSKKSAKIHFVHQFEKSYVSANLGDWVSSPYYYFQEFFSEYTCVLHSVWAVHWQEIERYDVVIVGGGGLLDNSDALNEVINKIINKCENVIVWGAGSHKYTGDNSFGLPTSVVPINFNGLSLCGIRDYQHPYSFPPLSLPFLPCASCLHPAFNVNKNNFQIKNKIGTITHGLDSAFPVNGVPSSVSNSDPMSTIVEYILSSEVMLVSSYHGAYWSMLLGRKVILHKSRLCIEKYRYFKYPTAVYDGNEFDEAVLLNLAEQVPSVPDFLSEARSLNFDFFEKVKNYIHDLDFKSNFAQIGTTQILSKRTAQLEFTIQELFNIIKNLDHRIGGLESVKEENKY